MIPIEWYHILQIPDIWYQLNCIMSYQFQTFHTKRKVWFYKFQKSDTNWMASYLTSFRHFIPTGRYICTSSRNLIPIEWYHILQIPDKWYQLNCIISYQFQIFHTKRKVYIYQFQKFDTNWMISYFTSSRYLIPIEWYQFQPVPDMWYQLNGIISLPDMWYQLNGIIFYQVQISDNNWMVSYFTSSRYLMSIEWYHIIPNPDICTKWKVWLYQFQKSDTF